MFYSMNPTICSIHITIQVELIFSLIITAFLCAFFVYAGNKIKKADPLKRPRGIVLVIEEVLKMEQNYFSTLLPKSCEKTLYPYFMMLAIYLLIANLSGLIGFDSPTSNYSITLTLALITFICIQWAKIKSNGIFSYIKGMLLPPTNILSAIAPLLSLSLRLFGNVLSGTILMSLIYSAIGGLVSFLPIDILSPLITPVLHAYFDVFSGVLQTFIFVTLSSIFISIEMNEE